MMCLVPVCRSSWFRQEESRFKDLTLQWMDSIEHNIEKCNHDYIYQVKKWQKIFSDLLKKCDKKI